MPIAVTKAIIMNNSKCSSLSFTKEFKMVLIVSSASNDVSMLSRVQSSSLVYIFVWEISAKLIER